MDIINFQQSSNQNNSQDLEIKLIEHDGSLVPKFYGASSQLINSLRERGTEILNEDVSRGEYIIYVQQYSQDEQDELDNCQGFHKGYTIKSFFEANPDLIQFINQENIVSMQYFLDEETFQFLNQ